MGKGKFTNQTAHIWTTNTAQLKFSKEQLKKTEQLYYY